MYYCHLYATTGETEKADTDNHTRQIFRKKLREGELDDKEIEIDIAAPQVGVEIMAPPGMEEMTNQLQGLFQNMSSGATRKRKLKVKDALKQLLEEEAARLLNPEELKEKTIHAVENNGIVFIDEIDKICKRCSYGGTCNNREPIQIRMVCFCTDLKKDKGNKYKGENKGTEQIT